MALFLGRDQARKASNGLFFKVGGDGCCWSLVGGGGFDIMIFSGGAGPGHGPMPGERVGNMGRAGKTRTNSDETLTAVVREGGSEILRTPVGFIHENRLTKCRCGVETEQPWSAGTLR